MVNELIARKKIEWIAYNYKMTDHAQERIKERKETELTIKELILKTPLAWKTPEDFFCLALGLTEFIVIKIKNNEEGTQTPVILTYISTKQEGKTVVDRFIKDHNRWNEKLKIEEEKTMKLFLVNL